ncbi:hypothetical protein [Saccharothrix yanglingensis]|uniref:Uncharacterized protein n=1 Tax=Saccharothrix yanglingensis TaxID=659496 RepID=A0ABU0WZ79_9PSEU|nr:hypothetical protein [Saccharothrix yanglingensis]MDQ2585170.1 hypothetical protein [Saccharothrix yanglingensis]
MERRALLGLAWACVPVQVVGGFLVGSDEWWWVGAAGFVLGAVGFALVFHALGLGPGAVGAACFLGFGLLAVSALTGPPLWAAWFGERAECAIVDRRAERGSWDDDEAWYVVECDGGRGAAEVSARGRHLGVVGDRVPLVFDRLGVVAPLRPDDVTTAGAWLVPPSTAVVVWFVAVADRRPGWRRRAARRR